MLDTSETATNVGDSDGTGVKLSARDATCDVGLTDGLGSWSDMSSRHKDMSNFRNGTDTTADAMRSILLHVKIPRKCKSYLLEQEDATWSAQKLCGHAGHA